MMQERGNVFFIILIAIVLFAALIYAFAGSGDSSKSHLSPAQVRVTAADILSYSKTIESRVQALLRKGCSETEINFNNVYMEHPTFWAEYNNGNSPSDLSCHVFEDPEVTLRYVPTPVGLDQPVGDSLFNLYFFSAMSGVDGIGVSDRVDLLMQLQLNASDEGLCEVINDMVGVDGGVQSENFHAGSDTSARRFRGSYSAGSLSDGGTMGNIGPINISGQSVGCFRATGFGNYYMFYRVLIPR